MRLALILTQAPIPLKLGQGPAMCTLSQPLSPLIVLTCLSGLLLSSSVRAGNGSALLTLLHIGCGIEWDSTNIY